MWEPKRAAKAAADYESLYSVVYTLYKKNKRGRLKTGKSELTRKLAVRASLAART